MVAMACRDVSSCIRTTHTVALEVRVQAKVENRRRQRLIPSSSVPAPSLGPRFYVSWSSRTVCISYPVILCQGIAGDFYVKELSHRPSIEFLCVCVQESVTDDAHPPVHTDTLSIYMGIDQRDKRNLPDNTRDQWSLLYEICEKIHGECRLLHSGQSTLGECNGTIV